LKNIDFDDDILVLAWDEIKSVNDIKKLLNVNIMGLW
jgi:hypothetical protein